MFKLCAGSGILAASVVPHLNNSTGQTLQHIPVTGFSPMKIDQRYESQNIVKELFEPRNMLAACNPRRGKYLTCACLFRGETLSMREIDTELQKVQQKESPYFADWIPHNVKTAACNIPAPGAGPNDKSGTFIGNNTAVTEIFSRLMDQFNLMLRRRAFTHWYNGEGLDDQEFSEAGLNIEDMINEYDRYTSLSGDDDDDYEESASVDDQYDHE